MGRRSFKAKDHIKAFNTLRLQYGKTFTEEEFRESLKRNNIPSNPIFFAELKRSGVINRIHENIYAFMNPNKPIHYMELQEMYISYQKKVDEYKETCRRNKLRKEEEENGKVKEAINLLKSRGFEIYAPVGTLFSKV